MRIQCLRKRAKGSTVILGKETYKFLPENDHVCEVKNDVHIETLLNNPARAFAEEGKEPRPLKKAPEPEGYEIVDETDLDEDEDPENTEDETVDEDTTDTESDEDLEEWAMDHIGEGYDDKDVLVQYAINNYGLKLKKTMSLKTMWTKVKEVADAD